MQAAPQTLDPVRDNSNTLWRIAYSMFEPLLFVDYKDQLAIKPGLASAWRRLSPTVLEFTLREDVVFHNGERMTAEDVAFSMGPERSLSEGAPGNAMARIYIGTVERVEAVDGRTVRIATRGPDPIIEQRIAGWTAQIISKKAYLAAPSPEAWERARRSRPVPTRSRNSAPTSGSSSRPTTPITAAGRPCARSSSW